MLTTNDFCKKEYGQKLYKISFDAGFSCPNRDGKIDNRGCIFCSLGGSGDFAVKISTDDFQQIGNSNSLCNANLNKQIELAKEKVSKKFSGDKYIAYFQAFTNTYSDVETLRRIYLPIIQRDDIAVLSIATRPDCFTDEIYDLLAELNEIKPVWVELGLQTINKKSINLIRRGYPNSVYKNAIKKLNQIGIHTITHVILYLPNETEEDMLDTVRFAINSGTCGIKLQLLHILKGTDLALYYEKKPFPIPTLTEYASMIKKCVDIIPENVVIHRLTGDAPKKLLIEPKWSADKKTVLNTVNDLLNPSGPYYVYMLECGDGSYYTGSTNDVLSRFNKHASGHGCKYSASHQPVRLIYVERLSTKRLALKREYAVKQLKKSEKIELVNSTNNIVNEFK